MPRGRPRKVIQEPPTDIEAVLGQILFDHCDVPGCKLEWHITDAKEFIQMIYDKGYKIIKEKE